MDAHALQTWKATLQTRTQHNQHWSRGLRQLWTMGRTHRRRDAFYFYQYILYHPAFAAAALPDGPTLLAVGETLLEDLQDTLESMASHASPPWPQIPSLVDNARILKRGSVDREPLITSQSTAGWQSR